MGFESKVVCAMQLMLKSETVHGNSRHHGRGERCHGPVALAVSFARLLSQTTMYARYALAHFSTMCDCLRLAKPPRTAASRLCFQIAQPSPRRSWSMGIANGGARNFATYVNSFVALTQVWPTRATSAAAAARESYHLCMLALADLGFKTAVSRTNVRRNRSS